MEHDPRLFESAWLKWAWAKAHAETLKAYLQVWGNDPKRWTRIGMATRYDPKHHRFNVYVMELPSLPIEWSVVIGDIGHNYRSCLDHIAWAIVRRGTKPPDTLSEYDQSRVGFPIYDDRIKFNRGVKTMLPGARRADIAIVRRNQPYHGGKRRSGRHAFAVLHRLSNEDKHRTIQPTFMSPQAATYHVENALGCTVTRIPASFLLGEPLQVGAQLAPIYVRKTGPTEPYLEMRGQLAVQPAILGVLLGEWLVAMEDLVSTILKELADPPTDLLAKLGGPVVPGA